MKNECVSFLAAWLGFWNLTAPLTVAAQGTPAAQPQSKPAPKVEEGPLALRVAARLVQVSVIVEDKKGDPVVGLTRDDFTIYDDGHEQPLSTFSAESGGTLTTTTKPLPPNTYSNRFEQRAGVPNTATVILFDSLNTRVRDQTWATQEITKFLSQLRPDDRVALYALGSQLRVLQDFTSDSKVLLRALADYGVQPSAQLEGSQPASFPTPIERPNPDDLLGPALFKISDIMATLNQRAADFQTVNRIRTTLRALQDIADHVARLPGRKNLVWVSGSFPSWLSLPALEAGKLTGELGSYAGEIEQAARALNSSNMAIYPVDARGLMGASASNPMLDVQSNPNMEAYARNPFENTSGRQVQTPDIGASLQLNSQTGVMQTLAERTGGHAFFNANDIHNSLRRAVDDMRFTYQLSYVPTHEKWDGKFHEIKVKVKRADVRVRHRKGYFALPDEPNDPKLRLTALQAAAWSPLDATSLTITVHVDRSDPWSLEIGLDPREVAIQPKDDGWMASLDVVITQVQADAKDLGGESRTLNLKMNRETYEIVKKEGMFLTRHWKPAPEAAYVRVIVRDAGTGWVGSVTIPVKPPAPKA